MRSLGKKDGTADCPLARIFILLVIRKPLNNAPLWHFEKMSAPARPMAGAFATLHLVESARDFSMPYDI
jgi:hypothetical protein